MTDEHNNFSAVASEATDDLARFTDSYASFDRIVNSLQRQYIQLKEEFSAQNERLAVTNRKLVEMTARNLAATEFLNGILNSMSAGVVAVDQNGRITHFNPVASLLLGIPADAPLGKHYRDIIPPGVPAEANALRAAESGRETGFVEKRIDLPDSTQLLLSVSTAILRDNEGNPNGAVEVFHDLTKVKKMEAEIARLNTLAALGEMAATIAHQVRNPLAGISGFAALLKRDMDLDDTRRKTADKIIRGVESLDHTITALLDYTRSETVNREDVNLAAFLRDAVEQFQVENSDLVKDMSIQILPTDGRATQSVQLALDRQLSRQLLYNIFTNAVEACGGEGKINITYQMLFRQEANQKFGERLLLGHDETIVEIVITDGGCGIRPEALESMFSPFFTTKQGGNGLGLAVVWKIIKAHGGDILAENNAGGGARFTVLFPTRIDSVSMDSAHDNE